MRACRTCLSRYELTPLFGEYSVVKFSSDQLFFATGIKIEPNDGLLQSACRACIRKISKALDFREISSKVDQMLRNFKLKHNLFIKSEQNYIENIHDEFQTVNIVSSFGYEKKDVNLVLDDVQEYHDIDRDSCSNDSVSLAKCKEQINKKNVSKYYKKCTEKLTTELIKNDNSNIVSQNNNIDNQISNVSSQNSDMDSKNSDVDSSNSCDNDNTYVAKFEEVDTKPILEINIVDRNPIYDDKNKTDEVSITDDKDNLKLSNNKRIHKDNKTSNKIKICNKKTKQDKTKIRKSFCNLQFHVTDISEQDKALGKISNIRLEDLLSKKDMDELFNDKETTKATRTTLHANNYKNEVISKRNYSRKNDISRSIPSLINHRYSNYFKQMRRKEIERIEREKEKGELTTRSKAGVDRRSNEVRERDNKLLSLAITPYSPDGPVQCKICNSRVRSVNNFKTHAKTHFEPEFACESCGKKFYSRSHMRYHQQRMHGGEKRLACARCSFRAVDRPTLRNHERAQHTGERPYICAECGAAFRMRNNLIQHLKMHFGVKNIQCELCPSLFRRRNQLWSHQMKVHFMTYTYHCYLCPETYKGLRPVKNHLLNTHAVPEDQQLKVKCVKTRKTEAPSSSFGPTLAVLQNIDFCRR